MLLHSFLLTINNFHVLLLKICFVFLQQTLAPQSQISCWNFAHLSCTLFIRHLFKEILTFNRMDRTHLGQLWILLKELTLMLWLCPLQQCEVLHQEKAVFTFELDFKKLQLWVAVHNQNLLSLKYLQLFAIQLACRVFGAYSQDFFLVFLCDSINFAVQWLLVECVVVIHPSLRGREVQTFILKMDKLWDRFWLTDNMMIVSLLRCVRVAGRISQVCWIFLFSEIFSEELLEFNLWFNLNFHIGWA